MGKRVRILIKLLAVVVLSFLFIWLIYTDERVLQLSRPEGELIRASDVRILTDELSEAEGIDPKALENVYGEYFTGEAEHVSYEAYMALVDCLLGKEGKEDEADKLREKITYKKKYKSGFLLLKEDWYKSFESLLDYYGLKDVIKEEKIAVLCSAGELAGQERIGEGCILTAEGEIYDCLSKELAELKFVTVKAYVNENRMLALVEKLFDQSTLENVWIMEAEEGNIQFFYNAYEVMGGYNKAAEEPSQMREQVGDITFKGGEIINVKVKNERISGKLLSTSEEQLEVEGYGSIPVNENCVGYQLYEELRMADGAELSIGYDFADFVLENGKVCAFLITRKEKMETIRVALKNDNFSSLYHDEITLACQDDMTIYYGSYGERKEEKIAAGQKLTLKAGDQYLSGDRVEVVPSVNTGRIQVLSLERSQGTPSYRGKMEIARTGQGLVLINEVLLEEYLYSVVPSEMPASYPIEALKAQAVCARTYGYQYLKKPGYGSLGAHVDDSVGYQVYNNIAENVNSTKAVKETAGTLLLYEEEPVSTYYYSTSCGFGADAGVWSQNQKDAYPYLASLHIAEDTDSGPEPSELSGEESFRDYILSADEDAYEREEPWFRWNYQVEKFDAALLCERLKERYKAGAEKVLTYMGKGNPEDNPEDFEAKEPEKFKKVYDILCLKRKEGGVIDELLVETDKGTYKVISEYNVRYILNQGGEVIRQDGSAYESTGLLPSAYLIIDTVKSGKNVVGYTISGGGYGHGVGMSQNGARAMGREELTCESILSFYFRGCRLSKIY